MNAQKQSFSRFTSAVALSAVLLAGCGGGGDDVEKSEPTSQSSASSTSASTSTSVAPTTTTAAPGGDHRTDLALGETEGIASQLVDVPGYTYADPPQAELDDTLKAIDDAIADGMPDVRAVSMHNIVADDESQNVNLVSADESADTFVVFAAGTLRLFEFMASPPAGSEEAVVSIMAGGQPTESFDVGGTTVFVTSAPSDDHVDLDWVRHGVYGFVTGSERGPLERWVRAYLALPEREPREDDVLATALPAVPGYAYVNFWEPTNEGLVSAAVGDTAPASSHVVVDDQGALAVLLLGEMPNASLDEVAAQFEAAIGVPVERATVSGMPAARAGAFTFDGVDIGHADVWVDGDVVGMVMADDGATTEAFLADYFAALGA